LLRYVARPMVVGERVSELADGRIAWRLKVPGGRSETHRINGADGVHGASRGAGAAAAEAAGEVSRRVRAALAVERRVGAVAVDGAARM
jgi:hypothetical protein